MMAWAIVFSGYVLVFQDLKACNTEAAKYQTHCVPIVKGR